MKRLRLIARKLRALFRKEKLDAEMAEELRAHLELQTAENIARGMVPDEARDAALRAFGGVEQIKERARDQRGWVWLEQWLQDVRFAVRSLKKSPGFTLTAVLTLALGIGVNTSMFTAFQALLMRELPYPDADQLVHVFRTSAHSQRWPHAPGNFLEQQEENVVFAHMAAVNNTSFNLAGDGHAAESVNGLQASADIFPVLGIAPELGRGFTAEEDRPGRNQVVVLSHAFWQRRFAGDADIIGRTLRLDGEAVTVVGVMPARFRDPMLWGAPDVLRPIAFTDRQRQDRGGNYLKAIARLKPDVSLAQAQAAMDLLAARQADEHAGTNAGSGLRLVPFASSMDPKGRQVIWLTMTLAGFVLLITCANLANLQFARTTLRSHELAIRGALGAARGRLLRQLLTESLVLAALGGGLGVLLAAWGNQLLSHQFTEGGERMLTLPLNVKVLSFAFAAATISGFAFGLTPAWLAARVDVQEALKQGSRGSTAGRSQHRVQHALIVVQVALALVLLTGAGLVVRGLHRFTQSDPGWRFEGLTRGFINLPERTYGSSELRLNFAETLQGKLAALPGVERAALAWTLPISGFRVTGNFSIAGAPSPASARVSRRSVNGVTPGYFATLGMRLLSGRDFTPADRAGRPAVVIINETMARRFWPGASPLGQRIDNEEIVGVVNDIRFPADPSETQTRFQTYRPFAQDPHGYFVLAVRGTVSVATLRQIVASLDTDLPLNEAGPVIAAVENTLGNIAVGGRVFGAFAGFGLLLASIGLYGVIAGFVARRTQEIGIRMALGAKQRDVLWLVVGKGLKLSLLGVTIGLIGAVALARTLAALAPGLDADAPLAIAGLTALLVSVALFACWIPARRAAKVDPLIALRAE